MAEGPEIDEARDLRGGGRPMGIPCRSGRISRRGFRRRFLAMLALLPVAAYADGGWRDGDIVFHTSRSAQSEAIQRATHSAYSHMGLVFLRDGVPYVLEAVETVRYTPLDRWIARGAGGRYAVKRLRRALAAADAAKLRAAAKAFAGKPYDPYFAWSDERIYCSELVWKAYQRALGI